MSGSGESQQEWRRVVVCGPAGDAAVAATSEPAAVWDNPATASWGGEKCLLPTIPTDFILEHGLVSSAAKHLFSVTSFQRCILV